MQDQEIYELAVIRFGKEAQLDMWHEEVGELMQAINKHKRNPSSITMANISEEIADLQIMNEQLKVIYQNHEQVQEIKAAKLQKLSKRLGI